MEVRMNELLAPFIPEARDLWEQAGAGMLALERDANSQVVINDVFRAGHTLKGSSGLFDVGPLRRLVHAAEDLLGEVRNGDLALNSDIVGRWIDSLEAREQLPGDAETTTIERVAVLRSWLARGRAAGAVTEQGSAAFDEPPGWRTDLPEADRIAAFAAAAGRPLLAWSFDPEEDCFSRGDDPIAMFHHSLGMLALRIAARGPFPAFDLFDPLTCQLRFQALSDTSREALEEHMRYVADRIEIRRGEPRRLSIATGARARAPVPRDFAVLARKYIAAGDRKALERSVTTLLGMIAPSSLQASALRWCSALLASQAPLDSEFERLIEAIETGEAPPLEPPPVGNPHIALARRIALEQIRVLETPADPAIAPGRLAAVSGVLKAVLSAVGAAPDSIDVAVAAIGARGDPEPLRRLVSTLGARSEPPAPSVAAVAPGPAAPPAPPPKSGSDGRSIPRVLRVEQAKIDVIMNLVAELIVAKNGLSYLATRAEQVHGSRAVAREIKDQFAVIDQITQGLQVGVMSVRMMPVSQLFQRFPRFVRDISRNLGKKIALVIEGEDTEADKNVLESLADPLIHMVRNSLDHGVETPEERIAAGQSERGVLRISARHENDFVVLEVSDDGRGIDPRVIKDKVVPLGLLSPERSEQINDQEAVNLDFAAGFSTKQEVSDPSERGVGMDVVRTAVLRAGGDVLLRTPLGTGTTVRVRPPLTMAVTRVVTIECRGRIYGIPMDSVVDTVRVTRDQIHRIEDIEVFVLRDAIIPLVRLARALHLGEDEWRDEEAVMVACGALRPIARSWPASAID